MNTSFLSAIPAAPPQELPVPARPVKSGKPVIETEESTENAPVNESEPESTGDTDKADAFAEMLAAMISVATPAVETHVEMVQPAGVETVTSTATDIPRDGAGSPLFAASFMTSTPVTPGATATTSSNSAVDSSLLVENAGGETSQVGAGAGKVEGGVEIDEAPVAELAALDTEAVDVAPEAASSTFDVEGSTGVVDATATVETAEGADHTPENELSIVDSRETTLDSGNVQREAVDTPEPVVAVDHAVKTPSTESHRTDAVAAAKAEVVAPKPDAPAEPPVAEHNDSAVTEAPKADAQPVATPETAPQDFTPVEEPYEDPVDPRADLEESTSVNSATPRKGSSNTSRPVASPAVTSVEPEVVNAVTAVESSSEVGVQKDVVRERAAAPVEAADKPAAVTLDSEAVLSTGAATGEASAANAASSVANSYTDGAAASTPSHVSQQVLQALAAYEAELPQEGSRSFEMLLDPPELGRLLVQMSRTSKGVDVRISAENEAVRSILETTGAEMQQSLQLSGFDLGQFSGSSSGGTFANGEEWVAAPTLQSFASSGTVQTRSNTTHTPGATAVNVMV